MTLKASDIEALVELFGKSDWDEVHIEIDGEEILLSKDSRCNMQTPAQPIVAPVAAIAPASVVATATDAIHGGSAAVAGSPARGANWVAVKAANLGTFYKASSPDAAPYVTLGAQVGPETEVCMIEVMKLFTTIRAGVSGIVREICASDGQMVEYGQDLMWIEPV
jgi:acetyl-CoA carboxylase biotin carboxyl carrier protein